MRLDRSLSTDYGDIGLIIDEHSNATTVIILAHGAGANMEHQFMSDLAAKLYAENISVIRFNFPYMQKGQRRPDPPVVAHKTIQCVYNFALDYFPNHRVFLSGKSFGGRMSSQFCAKYQPSEVKGLIFYGFPLHPLGQNTVNRADHLSEIQLPMLFLQGSNDKLANLELLQLVVSKLLKAELVILPQADHSFKVSKKTGLNYDDVMDWLANSTVNWMKKL